MAQQSVGPDLPGTGMLGMLIDNDVILGSRVGGGPVPLHPPHFTVIPQQRRLWQPGLCWQIILKTVEGRRVELPLELRGDAVVGLDTPGSPVDVDLSALDGRAFGVSRRHVLLRPSFRRLYAIDLGSTNGTFVNGFRVSASQACGLSSGDLLILGHLYLGVEIVSQPA